MAKHRGCARGVAQGCNGILAPSGLFFLDQKRNRDVKSIVKYFSIKLGINIKHTIFLNANRIEARERHTDGTQD